MTPPSQPNRRAVLRMAALAAGSLLPAAALSSCVEGHVTDPDPLLPLIAHARSDAKVADPTPETGSEHPDVFPQIARARSEHAEAMQEEVDRSNRPLPEEDRQNPPEEPAASDLETIARQLARARDQAAELISQLPRHRAGLVGSVAAGCAALQQLAPELEGDQPDESLPVSIDQLEEESIEALQEALAAEHAAIWVYGLVRAFLPADFDAGIDNGSAEHQQRRDMCVHVLNSVHAVPRPAEPAYPPPEPVQDEDAAQELVVTAEADAARAWHGVLERTGNGSVRTWALRCLSASAMRGTKWRQESGHDPAAIALPGRQDARS